MENLFQQTSTILFQAAAFFTMLRQDLPANCCNATKEGLLDSKRLDLDVLDVCPICLEAGVKCNVGNHPSKPSTEGRGAVQSQGEPEEVINIIHAASILGTSASNLTLTDDLAFLGLPIEPGAYHGNPLVRQLFMDVQSADSSLHYKLSDMEIKLNTFSALSFKQPKNSELNFTQPNLKTVTNLISRAISPFITDYKVSSGYEMQQFFKIYLAKCDSKLGHAIVYKGAITVGGLAGEARGVFAGSREPLAQGFGLGFDFAMDQVSKGVPFDKVIVPVVLTFGDFVQFGAVFVLEPNFPCSVMLTQPLSFNSWEDREKVCKWCIALGKLLDRQAAVFADIVTLSPPLGKCSLDMRKYFLKPIQTEEKLATLGAAHLMAVFGLLANSNDCKKFVVFPAGKMGMPGLADRALHASVCVALGTRFVDFVKSPGWPIIIYPRLGVEWTNAAECATLYRYRDFVLGRLTEMLKAVEEAGIVHLDVRLPNIMVKLPAVVNSGVSNRSTQQPELKLIDWDCCSRINRPVSSALLARFKADCTRRYPVGLTTATAQYHLFFLTKISESLNVAAEAAIIQETKRAKVG